MIRASFSPLLCELFGLAMAILMVIIVDERDLSQVQDYCNILALYPSVQLKLAHQVYFTFFFNFRHVSPSQKTDENELGSQPENCRPRRSAL